MKKRNYIVTDPKGKKHVVCGLREFCRDHGLNQSRMNAVARGENGYHRGWLCDYA